MKKSLVLILFFIIPLVIIEIMKPDDEVLGRIIATGIFYIGMVIAGTIYLLNKNEKIIPKWAKVYKIYSEKQVKKIELAIRFLGCLLIIFIFFSGTVPFLQDIVGIIKKDEQPIKIEATIKTRYTAFLGLWFLYQDIRMQDIKGSYEFWYSPRRLEEGERYEFTILPRSKAILKVVEK